jgi:hypothetical protein
MGRNGNDGDDGSAFLAGDFIGTVVPKDTVRAGSLVLRVGFEDFLAIESCQRQELMRVQAGMVRV